MPFALIVLLLSLGVLAVEIITMLGAG